jgi:hypothetical protein
MGISRPNSSTDQAFLALIHSNVFQAVARLTHSTITSPKQGLRNLLNEASSLILVHRSNDKVQKQNPHVKKPFQSAF